ncbi:Putative afp12-like protein [Cardinium endosymbiont of Sogatella furcifera]|uniref:CIS tube protein n=1 Tax=Cardinium endosymbiont of Sogatella furcifera TaxID=650378 RepID=UPI000E0DDBFC|nr:hypothetical protein [Cardinium endosymbiont of Sogatella furcifera]AXI24305.1 Putative afp12-like protein [Cardinium endosymbiont of Sogatella furcifera]
MSNVSKLVIKACRDNKFSSFIGEFITSINPENLVIKSAVSYHIPGGTPPSAHLLKYRGSPPKLLSFSLLFDNTGIMPGSNTIAVMEQVKQLQDVAYSVQKKNNAPNYIRVIWGQIDFKGRLVDLDMIYSMFQVDGTLVRAEAHIAVLEELVPVGRGESAAGVDSDYAKASGASATSKGSSSQRGGPPPSYQEATAPPPSYQAAVAAPHQEAFAPTPNGMNGAYSGAPPGAYDGGADQIYHGSNDAGGAVYASSSVATAQSGKPISSVKPVSSSHGGYSNDADIGRSSNGLQGGVAGNGPGGSGGGVGGGGHGPGSGKAGKATTGIGSPEGKAGTSGSSHGSGSSPTGSAKSNTASGSGKVKGKDSNFKAGSMVAAGAAGSAAVAAAAATGADSLRKIDLKGKGLNFLRNKVSWRDRLKMIVKFVKKQAGKAYNAGKKMVQ